MIEIPLGSTLWKSGGKLLYPYSERGIGGSIW